VAQLTERPPEWVETAPIRIQNSRSIAAPADAVWARIADHVTWPEWFTDLKGVKVTTASSGVGGGREVKLPGVTVRETFTAWDPPRQFAFTLTEGPRVMTSMAETITISGEGDASTITYTQGIEPAKGFGWLWKLNAKRMDSQMRKALDRLAALVE
jgi:uncharacterized protein YndB with AHSA1/START domain